jgi:hypothetical protein
VKTVRYFGQLIDPAVYRRGFGVRGWLISAANAVRCWLEERIVFLMLRVEMDHAKPALSKGEKKKLLLEAKRDPSIRPELYHPVVVKAPHSLLRDKLGVDISPRAGRYGKSRGNTTVLEGPDGRPIPIERGLASSFAVAQRGEDRSVRYFHGRKTPAVVNIDGDFDHVPATDPDWRHYEQPDPAAAPQRSRRRVRSADRS